MDRGVEAFLSVTFAVLLVSSPVAAVTSVQSPTETGTASSVTVGGDVAPSFGSQCREINGHKYCLKDVWAESSQVQPGETVTIKAVVENEGSKMGTISTYLGVRPPGETKSYPDGKKEYDIAVGERVTLEYQYRVPESGPTGEYEVTVDVWTGNDAEMFHSSGWQQVFEVRDPTTNAQITDIDPDTGTYEPGETVDTRVTVENTGDTQHTFYVGYSVRDSSGDWWDNDGTTHEPITLEPGERDSVTVAWDVEDSAPAGEYDVWTALYTGQTSDGLENRIDDASDASVFSIAESNTSPTASRESPDRDVSIETGNSVQFTLAADDADGDLDGVEWYVNGEFIEATSLSGSADRSEWTGTFDEPGSYTVEAVAFDENAEYSGVVGWSVEVTEPTEIDGQLTDLDAASGEYAAGDVVRSRVEVENTGNTEHTFYVGYSVRGPAGDWWDNGGATHELITLNPGERDSVTVGWDVPDSAPAGEYDLVTALYAGQNGGELQDRRDDDYRAGAFRIASQNTAPTAERRSPDSDTTIDVGEADKFSLAATDQNGNLDGVEWYVNGEYVETSGLSSGSDTGAFTHQFDDAGTYTIEAVAYDTERRYSDLVSWTVTVREPTEITADIRDVEMPSGEFDAGDTVTTQVLVENTGTTEHTFYVGYSVRGPDGDWRSNDGRTDESVRLAPGERDVVELEYTVPDDAEPGEYDVWTTVYENKDGGRLQNKHDEVRADAVFEVINTNVAPTIQREVPTKQIERAKDTPVVFKASIEDQNRNIAGVEWYVDGDFASETDAAGSTDTTTWETVFDQPGTYRVTAVAYDTERRYSGRISWTVTVTESADADISIVESPAGSYGAGEDVRTSVSVTNTGPMHHDFFIGYSVRGPEGMWYDTLGLTGRELSLDSGEQQQVTLSWPVRSEVPAGDYDLKVAVWQGTDRQSLTKSVDERVITDAFEKSSNVDARIDAITVESEQISTDSSTTVVSRITNTGYVDHRFDIRITGISPDGNRHPNLFTLPEAIGAGMTDRVEQGWFAPSWAEKGLYDIQVEVIDSDDGNRVVASKTLDDAVRVGKTPSDTVKIESKSQVNGIYNPGETVSAEAVIRNTGSEPGRYYVRYQARTDGGDWENKARTVAAIQPESTDTAYLSWYTDDTAGGSYDTRIVVQSIDETIVARDQFDDTIDIERRSAPPGGYELTIVTTGADGEPLDRAVTVGGATTHHVRTGSDGKVTITGLYESNPGRLPVANIYVNQPGSLTPTTRDIVLSNDGTTAEFSFSESVTVRGEVYRNDGPVIEDATVTIRSQPAATDASGEFTMDEPYSIPSNRDHIDATVTVKRDGELLKRTEKELSPGQNDIDIILYGESPIDLEEAKIGFLRGRIAFNDNPRQHSNPGFMLGWIASGIAVFGDVRDAGDAVGDGDWSDAGITLLGLAPEIGDAAKSSKIISRISRYWTGGRITLVKFAAKTTKVPAKAVKRIDSAYPAINPATTLTTRYNLADDVVQQLAKNGAPMDQAASRVAVIKNHGNGRLSDIADRVRAGGTLKTESIKAATTGLRSEHGISESSIDAIRRQYNPVIIEDGFSQIARWRDRTSLTSRTDTGNLVGDVTEALALRRVKGLHPDATVVSDLRGKQPGLYLRQGLGLGSGDFDYVLVRVTENGEYEIKRIYEVSAEEPSAYKQSEQIREQLSDLRNSNRQVKSKVLDADDFDSVDPSSDHYTIGPREYHTSSPKYDTGYDHAVRYDRDEIQDISEAYKNHKLDSNPSLRPPTTQQRPSVTPPFDPAYSQPTITRPATVP